MHHLMKQRVQRLIPSMASDVPPADGDLAQLATRARGVMSQATFPSPRHADRDRTQGSAKVLVVESSMPPRQTLGQRLVIRVGPFPAHGAAWRIGNVDDVRNDSVLRGAPVGACPSFHEHDNRLKHLDRRSKVSLVDAKMRSAKADHHVPVARQLAASNARESERFETGQQLIGISRGSRRLELERELASVLPAAQQRLQRAKHFAGPATKSCCSVDQSSVDTSISESVILMLLTDDGRPPRERLLIVPAVETIVPRLVCSM
jgi:hypothetical protein